MLDIQGTIDVISQVLRQHVPADRWPDPLLASTCLIAVGIVLAFLGARLLRTLYILGFLAMGAAVGIRLAETLHVDLLIGLVVGGLLGGIMGHLLFRCWLGLTAGTFAALLAALLLNPNVTGELQNYFDHQEGVGTGQYVLSPPAAAAVSPAEQARNFLDKLKVFLWEHRGDVLQRSGVLLTAVWCAGLLLGILLPRLTMILGTSLVGVLALAGGMGWMLYAKWPAVWGTVATKPGWLLAALGLLWLVSLSAQAHGVRRPAPAGPPTRPPAG